MAKKTAAWAQAPEGVRDTMVEFVQKAEAARKEMPNDFMGAFNKLMRELPEIMLAKRASENAKDK